MIVWRQKIAIVCMWIPIFLVHTTACVPCHYFLRLALLELISYLVLRA